MQRGRRNPRRLALMLGGGAVVLVVAAGAFIYFVLFPTSSPKRLTITNAKVATPVSANVKLTGHWTIGAGSVAGYRVREKLGFLPAESDAVGRTSDISGEATSTQSGKAVTITSASFKVAVNTLKSNEAMRDQHIQTIGIQSATYPNATFVLSSPLVLPASALGGTVVRAAVTGVFNIHGTARKLTVPLEIKLSDTSIEAATADV